MQKIKILIAEDHKSVRENLITCLNQHSPFEVVGEASNGLEAVQKACTLHPDIILMDVSMPVMNGLEATKIILKTIPDSKIIILTVHNEEEYITEFIRVGAKGYILKVVPFEELVEAIKLINHGDEYFNFKVSKEGI